MVRLNASESDSTQVDRAPASEQRDGYRAVAMSGGGWATAQAVGGKLVSLATAVLLTWLLTEVDFGIYGIASTIGTFLLPFTPVVMGDILLNAKEHASRLYPFARRLLLLSCGASTLALALLAIPIERYTGKEGLAVTVAIVALRPLLGVPGVLALSRLRFQLRYRDIATGAIATTLANAAGSVFLAAVGAGPLALAIPLVATQLVGATIYKARSPESIGAGGRAADVDEVRALRRDYLLANLGQYVHVCVISVDLLLIGAIATSAAVGRYFFAQTLAVQSNMLVAYAIGMALQPIFSRLADDPERQLVAFVRATRAMAVVAAPVCMVQAALALPILRAGFADRWVDAETPLVALSVGQAFMFLVGPLTALLRAQGRFPAFLVWQLLYGATTVAAVILCISISEQSDLANRAAWCVAGVQSISAVTGLLIALRGRGSTQATIASILVGPNLCGAISGGAAWLCAFVMEPWWYGSRVAAGTTVVVVGLGAVLMHAALVRAFLPETWRDLGGEIARRFAKRGEHSVRSHRPE